MMRSVFSDYTRPDKPLFPLEQKMSASEKGEYDRPHITDREAAVAAEAIRNQFKDRQKRRKDKKKQKKDERPKQKPILQMKREWSYPEGLRPGDTVLNRDRKGGKPPKEHDTEYRILTIVHFNGEVEVDFYLAAPTAIVAVVEYWDGSVGERRWRNALGSEAIGNASLPILKPQTPQE